MPAKKARSAAPARRKTRRRAQSTPVSDSDPLARFLGAIDLGARDVADRHDAYLADAVDPPRRANGRRAR